MIKFTELANTISKKYNIPVGDSLKIISDVMTEVIEHKDAPIEKREKVRRFGVDRRKTKRGV